MNDFFKKTVLILGRRKCGKTTLVDKILKNFPQEKKIIFTDNISMKTSNYFYYSDIYSDVYRKFDPEIIKNNISKTTHLVLVFDGISLNFNDKILIDLIQNNKEYNITVIITYDHLPNINSKIIFNLDNVYVFGLCSLSEKRIYKYFGHFLNYEKFKNDYSLLERYDYLKIV